MPRGQRFLGPAMESTGVLVSYTYGEGRLSESYGSSGILIDHNWILTHGSLMKPAIFRNTSILNFVDLLTPGEIIEIPENISCQLNFQISEDRASDPEEPQDIHQAEGCAVAAWKCPLLKDTLENVFLTWSFDKLSESNRILLPVFLLVQLQDIQGNGSTVREVLERLHSILVTPGRGQNIEVQATPFGNPVFIHSVARGVVSNIIGSHKSVILTDANAVPGCEGGPVYMIRNNSEKILCGMVIAPLSWCRGEWVDYTFVANLKPSLERILENHGTQELIEKDSKEQDSKLAVLLDKSVLVVKCGAGWGSGILLDKKTGTILTCSHVVKEAPRSRIKVLHRSNCEKGGGTSTWARLIYRTPDGKPYDVAVLKVDPGEISPTLVDIAIGTDPVQRGDAAATAGFPFFSSNLPTVSRGNVSKCLSCMIQTTCCVQSGTSGGPVVRWPTGEMLGMIVCNAISSSNSALYTRLNMAIPVSVLKGPLDEYIRTGDVRVLECLESDDPTVRQTWSLYVVPVSKI
ncbi:peroxisomal leader peptide-processing protease isoform X2 [Cephus cinctus]|uniref:Peroxisomal leader peptide-processing protease n=1 Tax=Cephus cinctus TaxID=211228 RepID=A0AAJ7W7A0_CEPCN|nr:peroxisomal leader peptide-processing protease isoform X2 [Cephus cinctus]